MKHITHHDAKSLLQASPTYLLADRRWSVRDSELFYMFDFVRASVCNL